MGIRVEQLPKHLRDKILEQAGGKPKATKSRRGTGDAQPCPGRCSCGEEFPNYRRWETKHWPNCRGRWIIDLDAGASAAVTPG